MFERQIASDEKVKESDIWIMVYTLEALVRKNIPLTECISKSLVYLKNFYSATNDKRYLDVAVLEIKAYLTMGGRYISHKEQFDGILMELGIERQELLLKYGGKQVNLNRSQIRVLIRKWMPSKDNPMKFGEVVDDIINKVSNKEVGKHTYAYKRHFGKSYEVDLYELVIENEISYFHDVAQMQYYILNDKQ